MTNHATATCNSVLILGLVSVVLPAAALAADLSHYRKIQLGTDLAVVARQIGVSPSQATVVHGRPAVIQELEWRPQPLGPSPRAEPAQEVVLSFYNGELYRIAVDYDQYMTEGLTTDDMVEALSPAYGTAVTPTQAKSGPEFWADREDVVARWQDPQYRFELIRLSYGPRYRLVGVLRRLEASASTAILDATRLDDQEAPQRDAARVASEAEAERARLEKARLLNKEEFRP